MRCKHCGEYVDEKFHRVHKQNFCKYSYDYKKDFSLKAFFKWRPFFYMMIGFGIWNAFWMSQLMGYP